MPGCLLPMYRLIARWRPFYQEEANPPNWATMLLGLNQVAVHRPLPRLWVVRLVAFLCFY